MNSFKLQGLAFSLSNVDNSNSLFIVKEFIPNKETNVSLFGIKNTNLVQLII